MNVARLLYPVKVLGPGQRLGIWLCGCKRRCPGCCNPELWMPRPEYEITIANLMRLVNQIHAKHVINGFTISGGEPFEQAHELAILLEILAPVSADIIVYSGYTIQELRNRDDKATNTVLAHAAVLIDGSYINKLNNGEALRGSCNQTLHVLNPAFKTLYDGYLQKTSNTVQIFAGRNGVFAAGIHKRGAYAALRQRLKT